jgi:hypothetical protein
MEITRRACLAVFGTGALGFALPALAQDAATSQDNTRDAIELTRSDIANKRQEIITKWMDFTPDESNAFWPLYREYQAELDKVGDKQAQVLDEYLKNYDTLTDDKALNIVERWLNYRKQRIEIQQKYVGRFRKILPGKKVARLYQLEGAMDAVISAGVQGSLPMVK